jgi:hypothetical protein
MRVKCTFLEEMRLQTTCGCRYVGLNVRSLTWLLPGFEHREDTTDSLDPRPEFFCEVFGTDIRIADPMLVEAKAADPDVRPLRIAVCVLSPPLQRPRNAEHLVAPSI